MIFSLASQVEPLIPGLDTDHNNWHAFHFAERSPKQHQKTACASVSEGDVLQFTIQPVGGKMVQLNAAAAAGP